ncbi:hypothetical protein AVEN_66508-1, partial [Araneus ventricosus]
EFLNSSTETNEVIIASLFQKLSSRTMGSTTLSRYHAVPGENCECLDATRLHPRKKRMGHLLAG